MKTHLSSRSELLFHIAMVSHLVMGIDLFVGGEPAAWATAVATSLAICAGEPYLLGVLYVLASLCVLVSEWRDREDAPGLALYTPQQFFMLASAFGAARAMLLSQFADGVLRPRPFIISDQHLWLFIGLAHTMALVDKFYDVFVVGVATMRGIVCYLFGGVRRLCGMLAVVRFLFGRRKS